MNQLMKLLAWAVVIVLLSPVIACDMLWQGCRALQRRRAQRRARREAHLLADLDAAVTAERHRRAVRSITAAGLTSSGGHQ